MSASRPAGSLSTRGAAMPASPIRHLAPLAQAASGRGVHVFRLNIGQPDIDTATPILDSYRGFDEPVIAYAPSDGLQDYRDALAGYYARLQVALTRDQILVTNGGSEALMMAFAATCDPGDQILLFEPCYPNYIGFATWMGIEPVFVTTHREDGYHLPSADEICQAIGPRTRAMVICNPSNPTGVVHRTDEIERLASIARERGLFLIADEVYREFVFGDVTPVPALSLPGMDPYVVQVDSISKRYSACGARLGWVATRNADLRSAMVRMGQARLSAPTVAQLGATAATALPHSYHESIIREYRSRRDLLVKRLEAMPGVELAWPDGAFYVMVTLPVDDSDRFCAWLLDEHTHAGSTVLLAPGAGFYGTPGLGTREVRVAYVLSRDDLSRAMDSLAKALETYPGRVTS